MLPGPRFVVISIFYSGTLNNSFFFFFSDAAVFQQYRQTKILAGFYLDFENISAIALTFSTRSTVGPKYKLRVLKMRLKSLSHPER